MGGQIQESGKLILAVIAAGLLGCATIYAVCNLLFPTYTHRYRLTVNIEADGKLHSGSSVIEVRRNDHGPLEGLLHGRFDEEITGESPIVDLGKRGVVEAISKVCTRFSLLRDIRCGVRGA